MSTPFSERQRLEMRVLLQVREELGYLVDLSLFLGKPLSVAPPSSCQENAASQEFAADAEDRTLLGTFPQAVLDSVVERVRFF